MVSNELSVCAGLEVTHALYSLVIQKLKFCNLKVAIQLEISWSLSSLFVFLIIAIPYHKRLNDVIPSIF